MRKSFKTLGTSGLAACVAAVVAAQDTPPPFNDFTFKRVGVPKSGSGPRIRVQITETAPVRPEPETATAETSAPETRPTADLSDWFWTEISPSLAASGPGRLDAALRHMQSNRALRTPRLDALRQIALRHQSEMLLATVGTQVSPALVLAVISVESSGVADAVSRAGATGLMQLMPATAERFGVSDRTDPAENIRGGVEYLDWLMGEFGNDPIVVLAAYNAGEGSVRRYEGVPPFAETRGYVPKVLAAWSVARALCKTPPELVSDGCAFDLAES